MFSQCTSPFSYLFDEGISPDNFMDFSEDELSNIFDADVARAANLVDAFDSTEDTDDVGPVYEPTHHEFKNHTNLSDLITEMVQVADGELLAPQSMIILEQKGNKPYDHGPPVTLVLGIYAFDRPPSSALLAIYMAMFQDCYHFSIRQCDVPVLRTFIMKHNQKEDCNIKYCYNENGNPFYHFENSPLVPFDGIVEEGINLFQELYKSKAMKPAGKRGPTPIVSLGLTTTPASQMREG